MFWRRARPAPQHVDFSGHFERTAFAIGEHAIANTYNGTVIQHFAEGTVPRPTRRPPPQDRSPRDPIDLLGRASELDRVDTALRSGSTVGVHGAAGVGKTVLLKHIARRVGDAWPDGVLYASVGGQRVDDVLQWLFTVFWDTGRVVYVPGPLQVGEFLAGVEALVVLDEVDHETADVERLLGGAPKCGFALGAVEPPLPEHSFPLRGLDAGAARGLFERVLGRPATEAEQPAIDAFVAHVDGVAGYVVTGAALVRDGGCSPSELIEQSGAVLARRRLLALPADQQQLLALLAELAPAPVPARGLGPGAEAPVERLVAAELVERHSPRYTPSGPLSAEELRDVAHSGPTELLRRLADESERLSSDDAPSVAAALAWGRRAGDDEEVLRAARELSPAMVRIGRPGAWGAVLELGLSAAQRLDRPADKALFLHDQGTRLGCLGDRAGAFDALTYARDIRRGLRDEDALAVTEHNLRELFGGAGGPGGEDDSGGGGGDPSTLPRALMAGIASLAVLGIIAIVAFGGDDGSESGSSSSETAAIKATETATNSGEDHTKPTITLMRPVDGDQVTTGARVLASYRCRDRGRPARVCKGTVPAGEAIDTREGDHTFRVHARDDAGNVADAAASYRAEKAPPPAPEIVIDQPADGATFTFGTKIIAEYECHNASTCVGDVRVGAAVNSRPGTHDFTVRAKGTDGTLAEQSVSYTVERRSSNPLEVRATKVSIPDPDGTRDTLQYACSGGTAPLSCTATLDGEAAASGTDLECGPHTVVVRAADAAGQTKEGTFPINGRSC